MIAPLAFADLQLAVLRLQPFPSWPQWHDVLSPATTTVERDVRWCAGWTPRTRQMERYQRWDAHRQEEFCRTLEVLQEQAERQYQLYLLCVLSPFETDMLARALGLDDSSPLRMAKRRGSAFMLEYCGGWIERDVAWSR